MTAYGTLGDRASHSDAAGYVRSKREISPRSDDYHR